MLQIVRLVSAALVVCVVNFPYFPALAIAPRSSDSVVEVQFGSFEDLTQARVLKPGMRYSVAGHTLAEDGAGGTFLFQTEEPSTVTPGLTYEVKGRGFFLRQGFDGASPVRAEWFGARGDGTSDDRDAIQAALDAHSRVNLMSKTYAIGKGLYIGWYNRGTAQSPRWEKGLGRRGLSIIQVKSNYRILGAGRDKTKLKLLDGVNPRLNSTVDGVYRLIGNDQNSSAANVVVRDLSIDVNFDGQSKAAQAPNDSIHDVETGQVYTAPNLGEVATINAISVWGPNALFENLKVVGYSSNTIHEAFVISSWLNFKDSSVGRQCATVRNIEMTAPGSNLEIKMRRGNPYAAEITHIAVGGAHNFNNTPYGYGAYSIPRGHSDWSLENRKRFPTMRDALAALNGGGVRPAAFAMPEVVEIEAPATVTYRYDPLSVVPANNLTVFAPHKPSANLPAGRLIRQALQTPADFRVKSERALVSLVQGMSASLEQGTLGVAERDNKVFAVEEPATEFYRVDQSLPGLEGDGVRIFTTQNNALVLTRIQGPNGSCNSGWGCDPAFDPSYLGENASNMWACEGGLIENVHIHDETTNPSGYDAQGRAYGLAGSEVARTNGSHLHGISVSSTNNMVIRRNRIENFMGPAVFMMSWWNNNLVIRDNHFDRVLDGVLLLAMIDEKGAPFQFPRHQNMAIVNNYIRLLENSNTYQPAGLRIRDFSNGQTFIDPVTKKSAMPESEFPRFENIRFAYNRVVGRAVSHPEKKAYYAAGVDVDSVSFLRNVKVFRNSFDVTPDLAYASDAHGSAIQIKHGQFYESRDETRQSFRIYDNTDLRGASGETYVDTFRDISSKPSSPATTAYPLLLNSRGGVLGVGEEREG